MTLKKTHFCLPELCKSNDESKNYEERIMENCTNHAISLARSVYLISDTAIGSDFFDDFERISELKDIMYDLNLYINDKFIRS